MDVQTLVKNVPDVSDIDRLSDWFAMCESYGKSVNSVNSLNISHSANNGLTFLYDDNLRKKHRQQVLSYLKTELYHQEGENRMPQYEYDVFVSYAHANNEYATKLRKSFDKLDIKIFRDAESIEWGDKWEEEIENALKKCHFGVVIISEDFYNRDWTEKELKTLLMRQNVLPILYNTDFDNLKLHCKKSCYKDLAKIQFIKASEYDVKDITILLARKLLNYYKE